MPPTLIFDISNIDLDRVICDIDDIRKVNPQRGDMENLSAVVFMDETRLVAYKDIKDNEFWVDGHIPGRPLFPGVLMIEAAAQAASFFTVRQLRWQGFIGFGGVNDVKFRQSVPPGVRMYIIMELKWARHRRVACASQGIVNGQVVFEAEIIGTMM